MTDLLGLPLEEALKRIVPSQTEGLLVTKYSAPRGENARGTLRVVRVEDAGKRITVCAFNDSVNEDKAIDEA